MYHFLENEVDLETVRKGLIEQKKTHLTTLAALLGIDVVLGKSRFSDVASILTCALILYTLSLRGQLDHLPPARLEEYINALGKRTFALINAVPGLGISVVCVLQVFYFVHSPRVALAIVAVGRMPNVLLFAPGACTWITAKCNVCLNMLMLRVQSGEPRDGGSVSG